MLLKKIKKIHPVKSSKAGTQHSKCLSDRLFNRVHFIGIGGIGVSALAKMALEQGKTVSGSDIYSSEITQELENLKVPIFLKHKKDNISKDIDLVVYSTAVPEHNPERLRAKELNIIQLSYPQFLGELSRQKNTIAVSGTNGKSTTTAILGLILEKAGLDPTVIVGSKVGPWQSNLRMGRSDILLVEACEWQANMLSLDPSMIVLTNLEPDHLDYYRDIDHLVQTFQKYINKLPQKGVLILNADDNNLKKLKPDSQVITYGIKNIADVMARNILSKPGKQEFDLTFKGATLKSCRVSIKIPGLFNIYNILSACAAAINLGVDLQTIKKTVEQFSGIWRRFEKLDAIPLPNYPNTRLSKYPIVISDYAHHPTAVKGTIQAAKDFYPDKRIVAVFQPHHHNRTKKLFNDFLKSFDNADLTIITEIYDVAGRDEDKDQDISSKDLVRAIKSDTRYPIYYAKNLKQTKKLILKNIQPNDLVLFMGAGDIDDVARELVK